MSKVIVRPIFLAFGSPSDKGLVGKFEIEMEVKKGCETDLCEDIFMKTQNLDENGWLNNAIEAGNFTPVEDKIKTINGHKSMRSMSCDDVLLVEFSENDIGYFLCDYAGFKELSEFQYAAHAKKKKG